MSPWEQHFAPHVPVFVLTMCATLVLGLVALYIRDVTRKYPHSSDPNFGSRLFWSRMGAALFWAYYGLLVGWPVWVALIVVFTIRYFVIR